MLFSTLTYLSRCDEGWSGDDCSCDESESRCLSPYNREVCSGHGACECNRCNCDAADDGRVFSGMTTEFAHAHV